MFAPRTTIDYGNPVNRLSPLNRGLVAWWIGLPAQPQVGRLRDIASKTEGVLQNGLSWNGITGDNLPAQRLLNQEKKDMKQIIMITDGKPSAIFLDEDLPGEKSWARKQKQGGRRLYKNPMGLDPLIIESTLAEAAQCRRSGIIVNTFMLTDDYDLVEFVKQLTEVAMGKAYFTTSRTLGDYVMMDFIQRKTRRVK